MRPVRKKSLQEVKDTLGQAFGARIRSAQFAPRYDVAAHAIMEGALQAVPHFCLPW